MFLENKFHSFTWFPLFFPVENHLQFMEQLCVCQGLECERKKKILQANESLIDNEMDLFNCNFKRHIKFRQYKSELKFLFTLSLWYRDFEKKNKKRPSCSILGEVWRAESWMAFRVHLHLFRQVACDTSLGQWLCGRAALGHHIGCWRLFSGSLLFLNKLTFYGDY